MKTLFPGSERVTCGNAIDCHEADVVTVARVGAARVAEANEQLHVTLIRESAPRRGAELFLAGSRLGGSRFGCLLAAGALPPPRPYRR